MMKTKLLWLSVPAAAAAGAGFYLLKKKKASSGASPTAKKAGGKAAAKAEAPAVDPASLKEGSYSFISGFQNAATVEVKFRYDGIRFLCTVMEDGFLAESGDSHVAVLSGEDFSAQLEYGTYYAGENFARLKAELAGKHADMKEVCCGENRGLLYQNGDNLCLDFPIPGDSCSYLHVTLAKEKGNDDPLSALPDYPDVKMLLSSLTFSQS
jgi:hypothetical protein